MRWWQRHFGNSTRGRVVAFLRRGQRTVDEIATTLGLTDNAVRAHLNTLEEDGIVVPAGARRDGLVGKPATLYAIDPAAGVIFSNAYAPVLAAVLTELGARLPSAELASVLHGVGRRLAPALSEGSFEERVGLAAALLTELGADADVFAVDGGFDVRSYGCPLAEAVVACPGTCGALEELLAQVTGATVREQCARTGEPRCAFAIRAA